MFEEARDSLVHQLFHRAAGALRSGLAPARLRGVSRLGARACVHGSPVIDNQGTITIGDDLCLSAVPLPSHLVAGPGGAIVVGDRVSIGPGVGIAASLRITIGSGARIGPGVMIMDTDFHGAEGEGEAKAAPVIIEEGARIDGHVTILKGAHIGAGAWIAAGSVVSGDIPAGAFAAGVPARVTRPGAGSDGDGRDLHERVTRIVADTFRIAGPVAASDGPAQIPGWDSLGALRLLLAIEEELGVPLSDDALRDVRCVGDLVELVSRTATR
ncbi:MAG: phosphopantetheine-binding protein [Minicystis sp.]